MPERTIRKVKFKRVFIEAKVGDIIDNAILINNVVNGPYNLLKNEISLGSWATLVINGDLYTKDLKCITIRNGSILAMPER